MREFPTGATRDTLTDKLNYKGFRSPHADRAYAEYMHGHRSQPNGEMREADNWKKGMPIDVYAESLLRHIAELHYLYETSNDYAKTKEKLCAVLFNANGWLHTLLVTPVINLYAPNTDTFITDNGSNGLDWSLGSNGWSNHTRTDNHPED